MSTDPYIIYPGTAANYISSTTSALNGDLHIRAKVQLDDYTDGTQTLIDNSFSNKGFKLAFNTSGQLITRYGDNSGYNAATSTGFAAVDGETYVVEATCDISSGAWKFYKDGVNFSSPAAGGAFTPVASTAAISVGSVTGGGSQNIQGNLYWIEVLDGIDGTVEHRMAAQDAIAAI